MDVNKSMDACRAGYGVGSRPARREFLARVGSIGAGALLFGDTVRSEDPAGSQKQATHFRRIDVHNHLTPPGYLAAVGSNRGVSPLTAGWTPEKAMEDMDRAGVATAITSIAPPGLWFGDASMTQRLARECNDYAARLVSDHVWRFGMFVSLPMPDIDASLREIEYGLNTLKADGVALFTNYGDKWLGDPMFDPLLAELNRRRAVVYTHPVTADCCRNVLPGITDAAIEWGTNTTRAIARLVFSGAAGRYSDIRFIFSHAGGTMPYLVERFVNLAETPQYSEALPRGFLGEAKRFYYDTAQAANPAAMSALRKVVPVSQIVFGTDYPFRASQEHVIGLKACGVFGARDLKAIDRDNALTLLDRFRSLRV